MALRNDQWVLLCLLPNPDNHPHLHTMDPRRRVPGAEPVLVLSHRDGRLRYVDPLHSECVSSSFIPKVFLFA